MKLEQVEDVPLRVVKGREARDLFKRIVNVNVFERAWVQVIPGGVPAGLIFGQFLWQVHGSEIIAERRQVGDQGDLVAADRDQQALATGMAVDVAREIVCRLDESVLRVQDIAQGPDAVGCCGDENGGEDDESSLASAGALPAPLIEKLRSDAHDDKEAEEGHNDVVAGLRVILVSHEADVSSDSENRTREERVHPEAFRPVSRPV